MYITIERMNTPNAGTIFCYKHSSEIYILCLLEKHGKITLPGGKRIYPETPVEVAIRETLEECNGAENLNPKIISNMIKKAPSVQFETKCNIDFVYFIVDISHKYKLIKILNRAGPGTGEGRATIKPLFIKLRDILSQNIKNFEYDNNIYKNNWWLTYVMKQQPVVSLIKSLF